MSHTGERVREEDRGNSSVPVRLCACGSVLHSWAIT